MAKDLRHGAFITALIGVEWMTIAAGVVASSAVLVNACLDRQAHRRDDAKPVVKAKSACEGGTGTLATLHAWLDGAELPAEPTGPEPAIDDALRTRGAALFAQHCATCHGARGDATGPSAAQLRHPPANFTIGTYELRTTEHEALPTDVDLFRTITRGVHGTAMPPWFALSERDRWALAAHLKTLSKQFAEDEAPPPIDISHPPTITDARVAHGHQLYDTAGCASCHGANGRGDGPAATALSYKSGAPAHPRDLRAGRFHRGTRLGEIYLTLVAGLDGTPMASFAKVQTTDDLWDVAMYVHALVPPVSEVAGGIRCPQIPEAVRCVQLPEGLDCPDPTLNPDELVGARMQMRSLHPNH
jgi:mono/diheme cytochrome c family protein